MGGWGRQVRAVAATLIVATVFPLASASSAGADEGSPDRYDLAGGCWDLDGAGAPDDPIRFQATDLARYLLVDHDGRFLANGSRAAAPSPATEWLATAAADGRIWLHAAEGGAALTSEPVTARPADGCTVLPDIDTGVTGPVLTGASPVDQVQGFLDSHLHITAFEFLGGKAHCGRPWHPYGVTYALSDCPDHQVADGSLAVFENLLSDGEPLGTHDPVGWPSFEDWPANRSLTHEQTYFRWLERAWRGGLRMIVNLFTDNRVLCELYPYKQNSCDEMDSARLQAQRIHELERYVDAQSGGPGEGWLRIVTDPYAARAVMNSGKVAVVLGIELSEPFGCRSLADVSLCTEQQLDQRIDELYALGVRQMFAIHKFDNALGGVTGDTGSIGAIINGGNLLSTGHFLDMESCDPPHPGEEDSHQSLPVELGQPVDDVGALLDRLVPAGVPTAPLYPPGPVCNTRGLTALGQHAVRTMIDRHMLIDVDHMSLRARQGALDLIEAAHYPGVVSSHSWATPDAEPRILNDGGMVSLYAGNSWNFAESWKRVRALAPDPATFGLGYGADMNGLGGQGKPRHGPNPVTYPFTGLGGTTIQRQVSGTRTFDINVDGVAHYGLYPDWIEDLRRQEGDQIVEDLARGPETYLRMWERADGIAPPPNCDTPVDLGAVRVGMSAADALRVAGQPTRRAGDELVWCDQAVTFGADGLVASTAGRATAVAPAGRRAEPHLPATGRPDAWPVAAALLMLTFGMLARRLGRRGLTHRISSPAAPAGGAEPARLDRPVDGRAELGWHRPR